MGTLKSTVSWKMQRNMQRNMQRHGTVEKWPSARCVALGPLYVVTRPSARCMALGPKRYGKMQFALGAGAAELPTDPRAPGTAELSTGGTLAPGTAELSTGGTRNRLIYGAMWKRYAGKCNGATRKGNA